MRWSNMYPRGGGEGGLRFFFDLVLNKCISMWFPLKCPMVIYNVPNLFPKFLIGSPYQLPCDFLPYVLPKVLVFVNYICSTKENNNIIWLWIILICSLVSHFLVRSLKYWDIKSSPWQKLKFQKIFLLLKP
jgi:hypothetical protein